MNALLAASSLWSSILALALGARSVHAALLGVVTAIISAIYVTSMTSLEMSSQMLHWIPLMAEVLLIVGGGLLMSETVRHAGAQADLANWIKARAGTGLGAVLLVVHGITPFAESVTGFVIGVTIGIPLLVFLGLPARTAAIVGLLGLCAVPWGSMAPGTMIAAELAGVSFENLGIASAVFSVIPFSVSGMIAAWMVSEPGERPKALCLAFASAVTLAVLVGLSNYLFGTPPAGALGTILLISLHLLWGHRLRLSPAALTHAGRRALRAYGVLLGGVLVTAHRAWVQRMAIYAVLTAAVLLGIVNLAVGLFHRL